MRSKPRLIVLGLSCTLALPGFLARSQEKSPEERKETSSNSEKSVEVTQAWLSNKMECTDSTFDRALNPGREPDKVTMTPKDGSVFLAVEVEFKKDLRNHLVVVDRKALPNGSSSPVGIVLGDAQGELHLRSSEAVLIDSAGERYSPFAALGGMVFISRTPEGPKSFAADCADPQMPGLPRASGRVIYSVGPSKHLDLVQEALQSSTPAISAVLVYEIPVGRTGFSLKIANTEPIPLTVKPREKDGRPE